MPQRSRRSIIVPRTLQVLASAALLLALLGLPSPWQLPVDTASPPLYRGVILVQPQEGLNGVGSVLIEMLEGPAAGQQVAVEVDLGDEVTGAFYYNINEEVLISEAQWEGGAIRRTVADRSRGGILIFALLIFAAAVALVGGWRGVRSLLSLVVVLIALLRFGIPAILSGAPPLLAAAGVALAVTVVTSLVTEGPTRRATAAIIGIGASLIIACATSVALDGILSFTPIGGNMEILNLVPLLDGNVDLRGIGLAATLIGTLGIIDDVAITQIAAVDELRTSDPRASGLQIGRRAHAIGQSHIGAVVNTLPLAYLAAALPLVVATLVAPGGILARFGTEQVAVELVRSLVGTLGVLAASPLSTAAAILVGVGELD
ncbi:MAG: YibE/F family protein [Chloroflexi bacterium]|nr:MAG: YibE/F family protein [Chloroflexota bacterium]RLT28995.1 MAG: YibE/F family protein [Chloroflexota bacterium]